MRDAGYTLMELLVALSLLGLLSVMATNGLWFGARAWSSVDGRTDSAEELEAVRNYLSRQVSSIYPVTEDAESPQPIYAIDGDRDEITFTAPVPEPWTAGGLYRVTLFLERNAGRKDLMVAWQPLGESRFGPRRDPDAVKAVVAEGVSKLELDYFEPEIDRRPAGWRDRWSRREDLPELIRLKIAFADGEINWPDLIVEPRVDIDAACVYDPVSRRCRKQVDG